MLFHSFRNRTPPILAGSAPGSSKKSQFKRRGQPRLGLPSAARRSRNGASRSLQLDGRALLLEFLLQLLGVVFAEAFLDGLGGGLDEVLGFLQAQASRGADD